MTIVKYKEMTIKKTLLFVLPLIMANGCTETKDIDRTREKTTFQVANPWRPTLDNRADVAIIYGTNTSEGIEFEERAESWKEKGYKTHFMTGIAWGNYGDYYSGKWDGKEHFDEAQVVENGDTLWHGRPVPYLVPSDNFLEYFKETQIKRVIDAGIDAIYLEEHEFW